MSGNKSKSQARLTTQAFRDNYDTIFHKPSNISRVFKASGEEITTKEAFTDHVEQQLLQSMTGVIELFTVVPYTKPPGAVSHSPACGPAFK